MQPESCTLEYSGQDYFTECNIQFISTVTIKLIILQIREYCESESQILLSLVEIIRILYI